MTMVYHVRITRRSRRYSDAIELDLSKEDLEQRIVRPFLEAESFMCGGEPINPLDVEKIQINETGEPSSKLIPQIEAERARSSVAIPISDEWYVTTKGKIVTKEFIAHPPKKGIPPEVVREYSNRVFIVHGKDEESKLQLARILETDLGLEVIILREQPSEGRTIIENIEKYSDVGYAFVILTPDDMGYDAGLAEPIPRPRPRQNVVFEFGFFVGKLGRNRVCVLHKGDMELPSDVHGVIYKPFRESIRECYLDIVKELKAAGYNLKI